MQTVARSQQRYEHWLRNLVQRTGDVTVAMELGVPRSAGRGWLDATPTVVVGLECAELTEQELRQEVLKLRRRVRRLAALLRLALPLVHTFRVSAQHSASADGTTTDFRIRSKHRDAPSPLIWAYLARRAVRGSANTTQPGKLVVDLPITA
jgi:hypothetical protein